MAKGQKISLDMKRQIAGDLAEGGEVASVAKKHSLHAESVYRLRRYDSAFQQIESELERSAVASFGRKLKQSINGVLDGLLTLSTMEVSNESVTEVFTREDTNGKKTKVVSRKLHTDPKLVAVKLAALTATLEAFLRVTERESLSVNGQDLIQQRSHLLEVYGVSPFPPIPVTIQPGNAVVSPTIKHLTEATTEEQLISPTLREMLAGFLPPPLKKGHT